MRHASALLLLAIAFASVFPPAASGQTDGTLIRNGSSDENIAGWSAWFAPGQSEGGAE